MFESTGIFVKNIFIKEVNYKDLKTQLTSYYFFLKTEHNEKWRDVSSSKKEYSSMDYLTSNITYSPLCDLGKHRISQLWFQHITSNNAGVIDV